MAKQFGQIGRLTIKLDEYNIPFGCDPEMAISFHAKEYVQLLLTHSTLLWMDAGGAFLCYICLNLSLSIVSPFSLSHTHHNTFRLPVTRLTRWVPLVEQEQLTLPEHLSFNGVRVTRSLVLCVCFVDHCLSFYPFSFGHCVVCSSSIYGFWLLLWYLQILLYLKWVLCMTIAETLLNRHTTIFYQLI